MSITLRSDRALTLFVHLETMSNNTHLNLMTLEDQQTSWAAALKEVVQETQKLTFNKQETSLADASKVVVRHEDMCLTLVEPRAPLADALKVLVQDVKEANTNLLDLSLQMDRLYEIALVQNDMHQFKGIQYSINQEYIRDVKRLIASLEVKMAQMETSTHSEEGLIALFRGFSCQSMVTEECQEFAVALSGCVAYLTNLDLACDIFLDLIHAVPVTSLEPTNI